MFTADVSVGQVSVITTDHKPLGNDHWAERIAAKVITIGDTAPQPIRDQAYAFRDRIKVVAKAYLDSAVNSDRAHIAYELEKRGFPDIATMIRNF